jgi:Xaa-Pro aminopeptidase
MKTDIDALMQTNQIGALLVTGPVKHNPFMVYLTGGGHITNADLIKKAGQPAVLFHGPMERDEAAKTGLITRSYSLYPAADFLKEAEGDRTLAAALRYQRMLQDTGVTSGRIALFGRTELGAGYAHDPGFAEIDARHRAGWLGRRESAAAGYGDQRFRRDRAHSARGCYHHQSCRQVADFITGLKVKDNFVVWPDGRPLTIGEVKRRINLWLMENGADNPEDTIFAIGRDAGVPHSSGNPADFLRLGQTIVFDIFPCEAGGGYFYDFTRTWCLGFAPDEELNLYENVLSVFQRVQAELKVNEPFSHYQTRTCQLFEDMGHPTVMTNPSTESGYVHSLGHGLGLHVHESPSSGWNASPQDILRPGSVVTIEPGLYYPERGMGVRLEDTVAVMPDGSFETLADFPLDLVLPMKS